MAALKKVLVVGGAGYLGSVIVRQLLADGFSVRVFDNLLFGTQSLKQLEAVAGFELIIGDCRDAHKVEQAMVGVDAVIHLAAIVGDPACAETPEKAIEVNYIATKIVIEMCVLHGIERFIFASTCSVYGASGGEDYIHETSELRPVSLYASMKIESEKLIQKYAKENPNFRPTIFRMATLHGISPRMRFDLIVAAMSSAAFINNKIQIFGGNQWRPMLHVKDAALFYSRCLTLPLSVVGGQVFNVGSNNENYRVKDIAQIVSEFYPSASLEIHNIVDQRNYRINFDKITKDFQMECKYTVRYSAEEICAAFKSGSYTDPSNPFYHNNRFMQRSHPDADSDVYFFFSNDEWKRILKKKQDLQKVREAIPSGTASRRIFLKPPVMGTVERSLLLDAFDSNWIAPLGPHVDAFEEELCRRIGVKHGAALSSGTAGLHLALVLLGVGPGDKVITSSFSFAAVPFAITYVGATPLFIDSDLNSWNMDPKLLRQELEECARRKELPKAVIVVDIYGQCADWDPILEVCKHFDVPIIEDATEALGATYKGRNAGSFGKIAVFSFNGNKIITTSGGGMLVSDDIDLVKKARFLSTQAKDPAPYYQHTTIGYNYRLSNLLAAVGRGQLRVLDTRIQQHQANNAFYHRELSKFPGISFIPNASFGVPTNWLNCIVIDPKTFGATNEDVRLQLERMNIESRPLWKPLHLQPVFKSSKMVGGKICEELFEKGLVLPSGPDLSQADLKKIISAFHVVKQKSKL